MAFQVGLVGCGRISQVYLEALKNHPNIRLSALMDIDRGAAEKMAEAAGCPVYDEMDHFAEEAELDGAIVCTPPSEHKRIACKLMDRGISVLCEKPLALSVEEGEQMVIVAEKRKVVLMMASKFRYVEDIIKAKSLIASGALGTIELYQNQFCGLLDLTHRWNATPSISGGGVLIDNGTHSLDIVQYLLGPIEKISVTESFRRNHSPVEESVMVAFVTKSQVNGLIQLSWSLTTHNPYFIELYGNGGALKIGWKDSSRLTNESSKWTGFGKGYQKVEAFRRQIENFRDAVTGAGSPLITPREGLTSLRLVEAAYQSLKSEQWVAI